MEVKELRDLTAAELAEKEQQLSQELFNLRFQLAAGRVENPMKIRQARRDLARVKTVLRQQALANKPAGKKQAG
ncbi:MAG: 50S ribosomal protein L29 [Nitrospirae bacterium RIFCSPLOWO2_02_FULL_62_14]|nr:MAG: 50S ribosomal protein L29 [Nitrospirae bacterium RIFCSPLOWO2_02_FULL_62_14]OGW69354.1 MAG: 50S ribosomal protein L29 [Nitrospirae bacterium RIFCSPLOWO2_01_FULL_62_17]OGW89920.1 MAG: 50S ribosomal protein L29 [Nitrospirae bacterium RIFCSPLOWO2_12_FULL_63_8]